MGKKRGNHEGSVYKIQKNGRSLYRAAITIGRTSDGKPKRKTFTAATRDEAKNLLNEALHKHAHAIPVAPERQTRDFLTAIDGHRFQCLFLLALASGLRQGELLGLRWLDVDLKKGEVRVKHGLQRQQGKLVLIETKTEKSRRALPLAPIAWDALRAQQAAERTQRSIHGNAWNAEGFVFTSKTGTPLDATNVSHEFRKLLATTELPQIRFHDLRHTCATLLLLQGVDMNTIKDILGHSQISLTMNTYAHVLPIMKRDAAERLNAVLTQTRSESQSQGTKPS